MRFANLYATGLALLGVWEIYATVGTLRRSSGSSWKRKRLLFVSFLLSGSCAMCAVSLWTDRFRAWMVMPLGVSYLLMIPMPCYFESMNRIRWLHMARNFLFVAVAAGCFAFAMGLIPAVE
jgi:hypothetical protein